MRPRFRRDRLVGRTGIFGDPTAIGVRFGKRLGPRRKPRRDLRVADHAGASATWSASRSPRIPVSST